MWKIRKMLRWRFLKISTLKLIKISLNKMQEAQLSLSESPRGSAGSENGSIYDVIEEEIADFEDDAAISTQKAELLAQLQQ